MCEQRARETKDRLRTKGRRRAKKEVVHRVRYVAQEDISGNARLRGWRGFTGSYWLVLEGCTMSVFKDRAGDPKYCFNVRNVEVTCEVGTTGDMVVCLDGKVMRFVLDDEQTLERWRDALKMATDSDIEEFFTLGKALGRGAFGEVVEATEISSGEKRAIKIMQRPTNERKQMHLSQEIGVLREVSHESIVKTYQIYDLKRTIYIVMEYIPGGDLFDFISKHDNLTEAQASQVMRSLLTVTRYLHSLKIVHRDLKPENILCTNESWPLRIKVSDFGFAKVLEKDVLTRSTVGTAYFMAPEVITNKGHGTPVDLYACGVILYTILTGRLPFPGRNLTEYFQNVVSGAAYFPNSLWKGISTNAQSLVRALLQVDPRKRLTSLGALQHTWINDRPPDNAIKRDRSGLHSSDRKLLKARRTFLAISMAQKVKRLHELNYGLAKLPEAIDAVERGAKTAVQKTASSVRKTAGGVQLGVRRTAENLEKGVRKTAEGVEKGVKMTGRGVKQAGKGIGWGLDKLNPIGREKLKRASAKLRFAQGFREQSSSSARQRRLFGRGRDRGENQAPDLDLGLQRTDRITEPEDFTNNEDENTMPLESMPSESSRTQSNDSFVTAPTSLEVNASKGSAHSFAIEERRAVSDASPLRTNFKTRSFDENSRATPPARVEYGGEIMSNTSDATHALSNGITASDNIEITLNKRPAEFLRLLQAAGKRREPESNLSKVPAISRILSED